MSAARYKLQTIHKISPLLWNGNNRLCHQGTQVKATFSLLLCFPYYVTKTFTLSGLNRGTYCVKNHQLRYIATSFWLCKTTANPPTDVPPTGKGRNSSSKGAGKDHFCCPKCGNPCTNVETFVCMIPFSYYYTY